MYRLLCTDTHIFYQTSCQQPCSFNALTSSQSSSQTNEEQLVSAKELLFCPRYSMQSKEKL